MGDWFEIILIITLALLAIACVVCLYRVVKGPSMPDRVMALDMVGINLIASVAIFSMLIRSQAFMEVILMLGVLAFIGTIAFSKYLERGVVFEQRRNR